MQKYWGRFLLSLLTFLSCSFCIMTPSNIFASSFYCSSESVKTDDLRDLLDDLEEPPVRLSATPHSGSSSVQGGSSRCSGPHLAGTSVPQGMATAATLRLASIHGPVLAQEGHH